MVARTARPRLNFPLALVAALIVGLAAATAAAVLPAWRLESLVMDLGLPSVLPMTAPPLGTTARLGLMLVSAGLTGGATWLAVRQLAPKQRVVSTAARRKDAHPDAPLRAPVKAMRDLGTPFLDVGAAEQLPEPAPIERELPQDLNQPLAAFDPKALPETPVAPAEPVTPLYRAPEPPAIRIVSNNPAPVEEAITAPETEVTIQALLDRLERGVRQRGGRPALTEQELSPELDDTLTSLRRFAAVG